ncbi:HlyD family secretion protein [Permianibacter aggregans]|uniref:HlyD family secretion protein n=1 Tax=Permianibacter aggregans TaxID=1510150 RepID=A0A4R6UPK7_9GAMM|nr:HlyD family efflux transporter periplasmic adaptor subunit [Permianibacter aggregans]QGX39727.1 HlyD family efflux transporter periplasmic adaptor subunit [Permianibacter aggregans]TDQ47155.1 HlyD family secretion protein [Permianibacter aggregans]
MRQMILSFVMATMVACAPDEPSRQVTGYSEVEWVYVAAPGNGWLTEMAVQPGQRVNSGDLLFRLDDELQQAQVQQSEKRVEQARAKVSDLSLGARQQEIDTLRAQKREAQAALTLAAAEKDRWLALVEQRIASRSQGDKAEQEWQMAKAKLANIEAQIKVAELAARRNVLDAAEAERAAVEAEKRQADWQLGQRIVESKRAGRIEELIHHQGEWVNAGAPVLALLPDDGFKITFFVPEQLLADVAPGKVVQVSWSGQEKAQPAEIRFVANEAEYTPPIIFSNESRSKLVFRVEAKLQSEQRPAVGQPVDVLLP